MKKEENKFSVLLKASRPLGWPILPLVFLAGLSTAGGSLTLMAIVQLVLLSAPFCVFYALNDVYDYASDMLNPRKTGLEGVKLKPKYHPSVKKATLLVIIVMLLSSVLTGNIQNMTVMVALMFVAYYYSATPIRFKERPPMDSFVNGLFYFFLPFLLGYSFGGSVLDIPRSAFFLTFCVMGIHSFSTIMDYTADKKAGDVTFAIMYGKKAAALVPMLIFGVTVFFGGVQSFIITNFLIICTVLFFFNAVLSDEKLAGSSFRAIFLLFMIGVIAYLLLGI